MARRDGVARFVRRAKAAQRTGAMTVEVGFFDTARYQDGTPVTNVAAWNEFGTRGRRSIPSRPFFRNSLRDSDQIWTPILRRGIDPSTMTVSRETAGRCGLAMQDRIQTEIRVLRQPGNAPYTIARKGSSNPLIDTSVLRRAVTWRIR